ncbi:Gfo/Idh/MocA family protein [Sinomonas terrae]|uniref:Gfo/Idh/MocA family oxidoreductase n=1 Tax=Sinomonas terrae TaxID=2908838 RepID=A0ABS9U772_9MICC|nr:Gfo/Idh/MocA family oxidoreductase [Sinomonas terrae]MCH6472376.1 Gfo/Idh/MocA family oxidoreductase [Sinomonas terrae]
MSHSRVLGWAILGTGKIAHAFAASLPLSETGRLVAVGSRTIESAEGFGHRFGAERCHGSYAAALEDRAVDAVYIATPHTTHAELIAQAAERGKHVLCEKPLTVNSAQAREALEVARAGRILLMEGFAFRFHPQTSRLTSLLSAGEVGEVRLVEASFGYDAGPAPRNYLLRRELAGGSILDVGCYTVAMSRLLAGLAVGRPFAEPVSITGAGCVDDEHGVDRSAAAMLSFEGGLRASVSCSIETNLESRLRVWGSSGVATLTDPWLPGRGGPAAIEVSNRHGRRVWEAQPDDGDLYATEADEVARCLDGGESPLMTPADSLGNMEALDAWRSSIGLEYGADVEGLACRP